jgi:hypothetical protein
MSRTYLRIPHARVDIKAGAHLCCGLSAITEVADHMILLSGPVLAPPEGPRPLWAHFVAAARLVYVKYTATVVV